MKRILLWSVIATMAGCGSDEAPAPQPPEVTVAIPQRRDVTTYATFTGVSEAVESAEIRARVSGNLEAIHFEPSAFVNKGQILFDIERTEYSALRDEAVASLRSAEADLERAESDLERIEEAIKSDAVSEQDLDRARANRNMSRAHVMSAQASLVRAELNLSYAQVRSPLDGLISRNFVDAGNLVGAGEPTLLATVRRLNPMYVYFDAPEIAVLKFLEVLRTEGKEIGWTPEDQQVDSSKSVRGYVGLSTDDGYPHEGFIDYIDNTVNPTTGTIEMRLVVPNDSTYLFPGLFVRVRLAGRRVENALVIEERAIAADIGGKYVFVVGDDDVVQQRYITLGARSEDGLISILDGLEAEDRYITNGLLRARPGLPVTPTEG